MLIVPPYVAVGDPPDTLNPTPPLVASAPLPKFQVPPAVVSEMPFAAPPELTLVNAAPSAPGVAVLTLMAALVEATAVLTTVKPVTLVATKPVAPVRSRSRLMTASSPPSPWTAGPAPRR